MKNLGSRFILLLCGSIAIHAFTTRRIYFTTNGLSSGAAIIPNFQFNYFWSGSGMGADGCVYGAASNHDETQGGGDVGVARYNPYTNQMMSAGLVTQAYSAAGNLGSGEYCNKVHTWLCGTPDGKVWFGSEDGGRGGHLLYVDPITKRATDYSRQQKFLYTSPLTVIQNHPELPISGSNGVALSGSSFKINQINPANPRYMWTESYGELYLQVWDLWTDSTRAFPGGHKDMRAFVVDREGAIYYGTGTGQVLRRTVTGQASIVGQGIGYLPNTYVYSHSYDTAYTLHRQQGELAIYDFINKQVRLLADLPDGGGNTDFRAMAIGRDGMKLYVLGNGNIYEVSVATGTYINLGSVNNEDGGYYAMSSGLMDTLGNWYITVNGSSGGPTNSYLLQVALGKDKITQLPFPPVGVERGTVISKSGPSFHVAPNPFHGGLRVACAPPFAVFDSQGRLIPAALGPGGFWDARTLPAGPYFIVSGEGERRLSRKVVKLD